MIFNVLACNTDSHAKNYSLMIGAGGTARLAPLYDMLCGEVWPAITKVMAQRIGTKSQAPLVHASDWKAMAAQAGLNGAATVRRVAELCALVREHAPAARDTVAAMPAGGNQILDSALHHVVSEPAGSSPSSHPVRRRGRASRRQPPVDE